LHVQILHTGDLVRARRRTWRVNEIRPYDGCRVVTLAGTGSNAGHTCQLLSPFDQLDADDEPSTQLRRVRPARWRRAARGLIANSGAPGLLRATPHAQMDILPHQLEPAVAVLRGDGCRILLADDVGLGKTIQAGVLMAELRARGVADRVLILTPPGLRDQWRQEISTRFHLDAAIADFRAVRDRAATLPPDVNPWTTWPIAITSIDYVKRPEVLRTVLSCHWDIVVVDEAHRAANDGDRRQAAAALTSRAGYVVLLTATPHSGNADAFQALCNLGSHGERLLIFRRTRRALTSAVKRRIHRLRIRSNAAERRLHATLAAFGRAVRAERGDANREMWIALAVLQKRAFSCARSLQISVTRRLEALAGATAPATQLLLPLDEHGEASDDDEPPAWRPVLGLCDAAYERRLLTSLADAAATAAGDESKLSAIRRLLTRVSEPLIIFTEYRDTLVHLARAIGEPAAILHGGLSRLERACALESFTNGTRRILLTTDAAAEGLNLHHTCRAVVNLELPWNPMRLEQRIGRVDRIGQIRTVHALHLIGADTGELRLLDELRERVAHAQADIGAPDPLDGALSAHKGDAVRSDMADVSAELTHLRLTRIFANAAAENGRPLVTAARNSRTRARLGSRALLLWECAIEDRRERIVSSRLVSTAAGTGLASLEVVTARCAERVAAASADWQSAALETESAFAAAGIARTEAVVTAIANEDTSSIQPGLFDRRAHFAHAALDAARHEALASQADRRAALHLGTDLLATPPRLRLVLVP
jgi:superfamily II DNA or RNA helicase